MATRPAGAEDNLHNFIMSLDYPGKGSKPKDTLDITRKAVVAQEPKARAAGKIHYNPDAPPSGKSDRFVAYHPNYKQLEKSGTSESPMSDSYGTHALKRIVITGSPYDADRAFKALTAKAWGGSISAKEALGDIVREAHENRMKGDPVSPTLEKYAQESASTLQKIARTGDSVAKTEYAGVVRTNKERVISSGSIQPHPLDKLQSSEKMQARVVGRRRELSEGYETGEAADSSKVILSFHPNKKGIAAAGKLEGGYAPGTSGVGKEVQKKIDLAKKYEVTPKQDAFFAKLASRGTQGQKEAALQLKGWISDPSTADKGQRLLSKFQKLQKEGYFSQNS